MSRKTTTVRGPRVQVTTDKAISLHDLAAELGDGVILSATGLPHPHPITGQNETATIYLDPASPVKVTKAELEAAIKAHRYPTSS